MYLTRYSKAARTSFLSLFEDYEEDIHEKLQTDVSQCFERKGTSESNFTYEAKDAQGRIAQKLFDGSTKPATQNVLIQLFR